MTKHLLIYVAVVFVGLLMTSAALAQSYENVTEKRIPPVNGKKLVLKGAVRDGDEFPIALKHGLGKIT